MFTKLSYFSRVISILLFFTTSAYSQEDSLSVFTADSVIMSDTNNFVSDTLHSDSNLVAIDSVETAPPEKFIEEEVKYNSTDSMAISMDGQRLFLYKEAVVNYTDINLTADYIEFDMANQEVFAKGMIDSTGKPTGLPVFTQGDQTFSADSLKYNFNSGKGVIYQVTSKQAEGVLHSQKTKRTDEGHIHVAGGKYTTCDADHPHFYLALSKAIVIPEDKIITGPSYFVMADIPTPLILPFGFFPNSSSRSSGILIPTYGEEKTRGFYLRQAGWYQVLGDYADYTFRGDIYSKGSWAIYNDLSYRLRYKFSGNFGLDYAVTDNNDDPDYAKAKNFKVIWRHTQDSKANPTSTFSANVNFQSSKYDQTNSRNYNDYLNSSRTSSVNYSKRWPSSPFNLSMSALASQNSKTETTNLTLPSGSLSMSRIYLFRWLNNSKSQKWYDDIGLSYSSSFSNRITTPDSLLFEHSTYEHTDFNYSHSIPLSINIKTGKVFNISPSLGYRGNIYNFTVAKSVLEASDGVADSVVADTNWRFSYAHAFSPSISFGFNPKMYGMYQNTRPDPKLVAIRHVISPSASFSYTPDMSKLFKNYGDYYDTIYVENSNGDLTPKAYSIFGKTPPGSPKQSGSFSFRLSNSLEGKRMVKGDTTGEAQKFTIIESLGLSTSYNPFAEEDEYAWRDIAMSGSVKLFKKFINIRTSGNFTMYGHDSVGNRVNNFIWDENDKYFRLTRLSTQISFRYSSKQGSEEEEEGDVIDPEPIYTEDEMYLDPEFMPGAYYGNYYADFNVPWSFSTGYNWTYNLKNPYAASRVQTLNVRGDISLTSSWKIGASTNYDIEAREFSFTNVNIFRDLHCFQMRFTMVPFGPRRSYSFTIQAKAAMLQDLKIDKNQSWYDNF